MTGVDGRRPDRVSRRAVVRRVGTSLGVAIAVLGGCTTPVVRTNDGTSEPTADGDDTTADGDDEWGLTVAVGPDGEPVFEPGTEIPLRVQPGTTVSFEWESDGHTIHVASQPDEAEWAGHESSEDAGFVHEHTFVVVGRYRFFCSRHREEGMVGEIIVGDCDCGPLTRTTGSG